MMNENDAVIGEVVAQRTLENQISDFQRAVRNKMEFRNLEGGTYALVRLEDMDESPERIVVDGETYVKKDDSSGGMNPKEQISKVAVFGNGMVSGLPDDF